MVRFLARRTLAAAVLAFVVASGGLVLARAAGGDYFSQVFGFGASPATLERLREARGLNRPLSEQYVEWVRGAARLDFGTSLRYQQPVRDMVVARTANSVLLAVGALLIACAAGIPLGILSGSRPHGLLSQAVRAGSAVCVSIPPLIGSLLLVWMAGATGVFPVGGMTSMEAAGATRSAWLLDLIWHLPVPTLALAIPMAATLQRIQAQAIATALAEPAVTAALARGVSARRALWTHALRLSAKAPLAVGGLMGGVLLSGSFAVELVTSWPGLGRLTYDALLARDVPLVAGCATAGALLVSAGLLASDILLAIADPRTADAVGPDAAVAAGGRW